MRKTPIVILTDFGTSDPYVGIMKGIINQIAPNTPIIDLTHEITPGDIHQGAITLWQSIHNFALGTIFLVVIDPGVGTSRQPIILNNGNYTFIAPDNGVLSFITGENSKVWEISNPQLILPDRSVTFHGRDIFAPAAAHASLGIDGNQFGPLLQDFHRLDFPRLESPIPGTLMGQILQPDRFGNLFTSLGRFTWAKSNLEFTPWVGNISPFITHPKTIKIELHEGTVLPWAHTFAEIPPGECAVLLGSTGLLEIVANRQSAANLLNLATDAPVILRFVPIN